jgi:hypothetical protein
MKLKKKCKFYEKYNNIFSAPVSVLNDQIVTSDSSGNLKTTGLNNLTSLGMNIGKWGIYQDTSDKLCFKRTNIDSTNPICFNGDTVSNGGGVILSPRNSIKAWVTFRHRSSFRPEENGEYITISKKADSNTSTGWDDGYNIEKIERIGDYNYMFLNVLGVIEKTNRYVKLRYQPSQDNGLNWSEDKIVSVMVYN